MKKIVIGMLVFLATMSVCFAEDMKVMALSQISTQQPEQLIRVKVLETMQLNDNLVINEGAIVEGQMVKVVSPKRLKRNASFSFLPLKYTVVGRTYPINGGYVGKYSQNIKINKEKLAKSAVLTAGDFLVKGLSYGYYAVEGAVKDEKGNVVVSSVNNVYKNSPLSYVEKGKYTVVAPNTLFSFKFPNCSVNASNY